MLNLVKRPCKIGPAINATREKHGEEPVPAIDIQFKNLVITDEELDALVVDDFWRCLFAKRVDSLPEPNTWVCMFDMPLKLKSQFKGSRVTVYVGLKPEKVALKECRLSKIKLTPLVGGGTEMDVSVRCTPTMMEAAQMFQWVDQTAELAIDIGEIDDTDTVKEQPELNLQVATEVRKNPPKLTPGVKSKPKPQPPAPVAH